MFLYLLLFVVVLQSLAALGLTGYVLFVRDKRADKDMEQIHKLVDKMRSKDYREYAGAKGLEGRGKPEKKDPVIPRLSSPGGID